MAAPNPYFSRRQHTTPGTSAHPVRVRPHPREIRLPLLARGASTTPASASSSGERRWCGLPLASSPMAAPTSSSSRSPYDYYAPATSARQEQLAAAKAAADIELWAHQVPISGFYQSGKPKFTLDDNFMMYYFKASECHCSRRHPWTTCPYAHPGETMVRRDPLRFDYAAMPCRNFRRTGAGDAGTCPRGLWCPFAHGEFETLLHPARYRTQMCRHGVFCTRPICFFAHDYREMRIVRDGAATTLSPWMPQPDVVRLLWFGRQYEQIAFRDRDVVPREYNRRGAWKW
uniref:C3H1-type domain-containing protein n=1 Tax=Leersia perrieri TaxID=77586 RepID=A0A0D9WK22_9ORYZ